MRTGGTILVILGILITGYYFFLYDTSVQTKTEYISGYGRIGGERVHNVGLMHNRIVGCVVGVAMAGIGSFMLIVSRKQ